MHISAFQHAILQWFQCHGRKHLPWQQNPTPYRVWVSEIMLQQTQVSTVIPYFEKFMMRFPTIVDLASAKEDDVLHLWTGLGYYSRARNLLRTAQIITSSYQGHFPDTPETLQALPGIGRSTASAILALGMQKRAAILDGNVKRVLSRVHALTAFDNEARLWALAEAYTPKKQVAAYTQAMMDLGAMICTRTKPVCLICPLQKLCTACLLHKQNEYPGKKPRKTLPVRNVHLLLLYQARKILLEKRPRSGIWGGLWSLPEYHGEPALSQYCQEKYQCDIQDIHYEPSFRHTFTHFHLDITPVTVKVRRILRSKSPYKELQWYDSNTPGAIGLAAPVKKLIQQMHQKLDA